MQPAESAASHVKCFHVIAQVKLPNHFYHTLSGTRDLWWAETMTTLESLQILTTRPAAERPFVDWESLQLQRARSFGQQIWNISAREDDRSHNLVARAVTDRSCLSYFKPRS